jgi:hypothetical protein
MPPKENPKPQPHGKQRAEGKKTTTSNEETNWLMEAWRNAGYTRYFKSELYYAPNNKKKQFPCGFSWLLLCLVIIQRQCLLN